MFPHSTLDTRCYPTTGRVRRYHPDFDALIAPDAQLEVIASGFEWSEGPLWLPETQTLIFSDIPRNSIYEWREGSGVTLWMEPSGYTGRDDYGREPGSNGLTLTPEGSVALCEHGDRRLSVLTPSGGKRTLVDQFEGKRLNSPNDLIFDSHGNLYFTDPPYGLPENWADARRELDFCGVYRLDPAGRLKLLTAELSRPNGIALSPDEKTLYVSNSDPQRAVWMAYDTTHDGLLGTGRVFADSTALTAAEKGLPDGFKLDGDGNLFATGPGGVHVYNPSGLLLGRIDTGEATSNCAWGDDGTVLYITSDMWVCRIRTRTRAARFPAHGGNLKSSPNA